MTIDTVLDAMLAELQADDVLPLIENKREIRQHAGKFTWEELGARNFSAPSLFLSVLGWQAPREEFAEFDIAQYGIDVRFVAGIVTKSAKNRETRNAMARAIAQQLTLYLLREPTWGLDSVSKPDVTRIRAEGLFVPAAEADNQSLWVVTWYQPVQLDPHAPGWTLDDFLGFDTDHMEPGADPETDDPLAQTSDTYQE